MTHCVACLTHRQWRTFPSTLEQIALEGQRLAWQICGQMYRRARGVRLLGLPALVLYALAVDPHSGAGGLPCLWKTVSGVNCPGCGLSRAAALLIRGFPAEAVAMNLLIAPLVIVILFSFARQINTELSH